MNAATLPQSILAFANEYGFEVAAKGRIIFRFKRIKAHIIYELFPEGTIKNVIVYADDLESGDHFLRTEATFTRVNCASFKDRDWRSLKVGDPWRRVR